MALELESDLVTLAEAAKLLKVSPATIKRWVKQGRLTAYHVGLKAVRIRRADLAALLTPIAQKREVSAVRETQPIQTDVVVPAWTDAEVQAALAALKEAQALRQEMLLRRKGQLFDVSWPIIRASREVRGTAP